MRKFGIEIEAIGNANNMQAVAAALNAAGIQTYVEGYNHQTRTYWKIVTDASVSGRNAFELVSPILEGEEGLRQVRVVGETLTAIGVTVNQSCGLHVHVDARDLSAGQLVNVAKMFVKYEQNFDQIVPPSRRNSRWCKSNVNGTVDAMLDDLGRANSVQQVVRRMNGYDDRYHKLNMTSMYRHGTVEFRQHSGTVNAQKMVNWVKLVTGFVTRAVEAKSIRKTGAGEFENLIAGLDRAAKTYFRARRATLTGVSA